MYDWSRGSSIENVIRSHFQDFVNMGMANTIPLALVGNHMDAPKRSGWARTIRRLVQGRPSIAFFDISIRDGTDSVEPLQYLTRELCNNQALSIVSAPGVQFEGAPPAVTMQQLLPGEEEDDD